MFTERWWKKQKNCPQCQQAGKNLKCIKSQNEFGKIPKSIELNEEITLDFAGPFQNANRKKKYLLVSVDNHSGCPDALFLPNPTTEKVIEFLSKYIAANGMPNESELIPEPFSKAKHLGNFVHKFLSNIRYARLETTGETTR